MTQMTWSSTSMKYPELAEWVVQWQAAQSGATSIPLWWLSDFGQQEQSLCNKLPDLRDMLNQARGAGVAAMSRCSQ